MLAAWTRALAPPKEFNLSKLRVDLRLYADLVSVAVFGLKEGLTLLGTLLTFLVNTDKDNHNNLNIILQFCRFCGDDFAGLASRKMKLLEGKYGQYRNMEPLPDSALLPPDKQKNVKQLLHVYFESAVTHLQKLTKDIAKTEKKNRQILYSKGEVDQERKDKLAEMVSTFEKLHTNTETLSDLLGVDMPEISVPEDPEGDKADGLGLVSDIEFNMPPGCEDDIWEDKVKFFIPFNRNVTWQLHYSSQSWHSQNLGQTPKPLA